MYRNRELSGITVFVSIPNQLDEYEGHKQGGEKVKGGILIGSDTEVCTFLFPRLGQADFVVAGNLAYQFVLEYLQSGARTDDDTASHGIRCLLEDIVGSLCGMRNGQHINQTVQFLLRVEGKELIHLSDILAFRRKPLVYIQHKSL